MKNYNSLGFGVLLLAFFVAVSSPTPANATVGGETLIYNFKYNPANESVYYIKTDGGGRGCPPILMKVSLNTEKITTEFSCDQGEKLPYEQVPDEITKITNGFKDLTPLNLKTNSISVDVKFINAEKYGSDSDLILKRNFTALVYQNGVKVKEFPETGCEINQPFMFQGYAIPGFNKKIIILSSAKTNCAEGGYIGESLHVVGGVDNLDKTVSGNFHKERSALSPNEGNLVVYEADKIAISTTPVVTDPIVSTSTPLIPATPIGEIPVKESLLTRFFNWLRSIF